jgi:hypothetical protein
MALPKQAQQQIEQANKILASIHGTNEPKEPEPELKVVDEPEETKDEVVEEPVQKEPEVQEQEAEAPEPEPEPQKDYKHQYDVLRGKYDAEVPRLHRQVADLNSEIQNLHRTLAEMQKPKEPDEVKPADRSLVTAQEIEEYGEDLVDLVGRRAQEVYAPTITELRREISELKGQLGGVTEKAAKSARDKVLDQLDQQVEDWKELNESEEFLNWLDQKDPYSGEERGRMLQLAFEANDGDRTVAFFKGFKREHAAVTPTTDDSPPPVRAPSVNLQDQVAPGKARKTATTASAQKEKRTWTRAQIAEFYSDVHKGRFRGRQDEQRAIERDIQTAMKGGRVVA